MIKIMMIIIMITIIIIIIIKIIIILIIISIIIIRASTINRRLELLLVSSPAGSTRTAITARRVRRKCK